MYKEYEMLRIVILRIVDNNWFYGFNLFVFGYYLYYFLLYYFLYGLLFYGVLFFQFDFGYEFGLWGRGGRGRRGGGRGGRCLKVKRCNSGGKKCDRYLVEFNLGEVFVGLLFFYVVGESIVLFLGLFGVEVYIYVSNELGMFFLDKKNM